MDIKRRTFIKALGLAAAGAAIPGCDREVRHLVPYVLPDDEIVPGVADWYATTCRECAAGCGLLVRVMEGRAKKIEGHPDHPVNRGKLCASGQAALQRLYHPDRLRGPMVRNGPRFEGAWTPLTWERAIAASGDWLRASRGRAVMISRPLSGVSAWLASSFMQAVGGRLYYFDPAAELPLLSSMRLSFGMEGWPHYDLARADYLLSFGAPLLDRWLSPVEYGIAYGEFRQGRQTKRGFMTHLEPRLSLTAASADRWIPLAPGSEGLAAMAIGRIVAAERGSVLPRETSRALEQLHKAWPLDRVSAATGIPAERLIQVGREFASADRPLAIGGGNAGAHTNGAQAMALVNVLNMIVGHIGKPGGLAFYERPPFDEGPSVPWLTARAVKELAADDRRRPVVCLLYEADPLYAVPASAPVRSLLERCESIISMSSFVDDSSALADLLLPDHAPLESWGEHVRPGSSPSLVVSLQQPVVAPLYDSRAMEDQLLDLAGYLGLQGFAYEDFPALLRQKWPAYATTREDERPTLAGEVWLRSLQQGGWWQTTAPERPVTQQNVPGRYEPARFDGDEQAFPYHFYPYPSPALGHGRGAALPWLQELPDPLTTAMWGSWIEINPATAAALGVRQGDVVRVTSRWGSLEAPVLLFPGMRPDLVAMPMGQGHQSYGRYASGRGANPLAILGDLYDEGSGAPALAATRVALETTGRRRQPVTLERPGANGDFLPLLTIGRSHRSL